MWTYDVNCSVRTRTRTRTHTQTRTKQELLIAGTTLQNTAPFGALYALQPGASLAWDPPWGRKCSSSSSSSNGSIKLRVDSEHNHCFPHKESWVVNNARIVVWFRKRFRRAQDSVTCSDGQSRNPQSVCGVMFTGVLLSVCDNTADLLTPGIPSSACLTRARRIR